MPSTSEAFGRFFRKRRTALGLNLTEFCRQNGLDKGNISRLERGLKKPPLSADLLETFAHALQLQPGSEDWKAFMRHAAIARGKLPAAVSDERAADVEEIFRRLSRRLHDSWVKARDLEQWSSTRAAQEGLPTLIRNLVYATTEQPTRIAIPGGDGVQLRGWDGLVEARQSSLYVPEGASGWEISVERNPKAKAERVFNDRSRAPLGLPPSAVTFVFVTSRKWDGKQKWRDEKREVGKWKSVEVYDSSDLEAWLELAPGVDAWIAERLGRRPPGVLSISDYWESLSRLCHPPLNRDVFLTSRERTAKELRAFLLGEPGVIAYQCRSPIEAVEFVAAYLATAGADDTDAFMSEKELNRVQSRTLLVKDRAQWDGLSQTTGPLNLIPLPSLSLTPEEQNGAVSHGHRLVIAATHFANHGAPSVELPRPSRYDLEEALRSSGFKHEAAAKAARAAGGSLSVLKRQLSEIPITQIPDWCSDAGLSNFIPMLLVGAWDDASEADRSVLSRLSGQPYSELQKVAHRLTLVEDPPLTRIEGRWQLVSPEDSWSLVGQQVTDDLRRSFEAIAIEVLTQHDESLRLSVDERLKASIKGTLIPTPSALLQHGICETTAILGSGFGPGAKLPGTQDRADRIVRAVLQNATWLRWATLGNWLPLLAEAAPDEFLAAISTDLKKKKRCEVAKLLADDRVDHAFPSGCKHAGLLWALEGLAWSPELLPQVCRILARLDEVDSGRKWSNRPASSLRKILLSWYPQTTARVEKRIEVLKSLTKEAPEVAWRILFEMLPGGQSSSMHTHRPVWRDWVSAWQERPTAADYWKQANAAADLIVQLVGNDPRRWCEVLDKLQLLPESARNRLIDRLRTFPVDELGREERRYLAEQLRQTIQLHRGFADSRRALSADSVEALERVLVILRPDGIHERHAWLFVPWLHLEGFRDDYDRMQEEVMRLRADALREIVDEDGFGGILELAAIVESPGQIGETLAQTTYVPDDQILPKLLRSSDANHQSLAVSYTEQRIRLAGWGWVRTLSLDKWNATDAGLFLSQAGLDPEAWNFAMSLGDDVFNEYWKTVAAYRRSNIDQQQLEYACRRLMEADRPESAINILSDVTFGKATVSPSTVMDALIAFLRWKESNRDAKLPANTLRTIRRLFGWLQESIEFKNDEPMLRLGQLEWAYLGLLDGFDSSPKFLIRCLSEDPRFFARVIFFTFPSMEAQELEMVRTEEERQREFHGYSLLMNWNVIPGTQSDNTVDEEQLLQWLESARSLCRDSGHLEVADWRIGEMLASWPQPDAEGTMWPCEEIRDAIEETSSEDLDRGFQIGILNSRGVTTRSPLQGGDLERDEAGKYRKWAERCDMDWPRTAASLRSVADSYQREAEHEDAWAAEQAHERH